MPTLETSTAKLTSATELQRQLALQTIDEVDDLDDDQLEQLYSARSRLFRKRQRLHQELTVKRKKKTDETKAALGSDSVFTAFFR